VLEIKTEADGELRRLPPFPGRALRSGELLVVVGKRNAIDRFRRVISVSGRCAPVSSDGDGGDADLFGAE